MPSSELDSMDLNQRRNSSLYNLTQLSYLTSKFCIFNLYCLTLFIFCVCFIYCKLFIKIKKIKKYVATGYVMKFHVGLLFPCQVSVDIVT